jgi:energy-coupling factor transporter transmembrane protein EcfT
VFYALIVIAFNSGDGLLSEDNTPVAILAAVIALIVVVGYLLLGKYLFRSFSFIKFTLAILVVSVFLSLPGIQLATDLYDSYKQYYARHHKDKYITQLQTNFNNSISPLEFDYKTSNYETLLRGDIQIELSKTNGERLLISDINKVVTSLPNALKNIRIIIQYGNEGEYKDHSLREHFFDLVINGDKTPTTYCQTNEYGSTNICSDYLSQFNMHV